MMYGPQCELKILRCDNYYLIFMITTYRRGAVMAQSVRGSTLIHEVVGSNPARVIFVSAPQRMGVG